MVDAYAISGRREDIQAAVQIVVNGGGVGTVWIPSSLGEPDGKWHWVNGGTVTAQAGVNLLHVNPAGCKSHSENWAPYTPSCIIHNDLPQIAGSRPPPMFKVGDDIKEIHTPSRVAGFQLELEAPPTTNDEDLGGAQAIVFQQVHGFRADHLTLLNFGNIHIPATANSGYNMSSTCYGVIANCIIDNPYKNTPKPWAWSYGIYTLGNFRVNLGPPWDPVYSNWYMNINDLRGNYGNFPPGICDVYIEDCHISRTRHALDAMSGGYYVSRYNLLDYPACVYQAGMHDVHGYGFATGRGSESYYNIYRGLPEGELTWEDHNNLAIQLRGGAHLIHHNTFIEDVYNPYSYFCMLSDDGSEETFQSIHDTYIWDNQTVNVGQYLVKTKDWITENVDYFLRAPNMAQDGFTYTPYPYPHPATLGPQHVLTVTSNPLNIPFTVRKVA